MIESNRVYLEPIFSAEDDDVEVFARSERELGSVALALLATKTAHRLGVANNELAVAQVIKADVEVQSFVVVRIFQKVYSESEVQRIIRNPLPVVECILTRIFFT